MKALEWQRFLEHQRDRHRKTLFRVAELAHAAGRDRHALNVELARLVVRGVVTRYAPGVYGLPNVAAPESLVAILDDDAYLTGLYVLARHNLITQQPMELTCFTRRRHNRSARRETVLGSVVFVTVGGRVYARPEEGVLASPEQALCDFVYLMRRRGLDPAGAVTFRNLDRLSAKRMGMLLTHYPATVAATVNALLSPRANE